MASAWYPCLCMCGWLLQQVDERIRVREKSELHSCVSPACTYSCIVYSAALFQSRILKRLSLKEDNACHSCYHKNSSLPLLQAICFCVLEEPFLTLWLHIAHLFCTFNLSFSFSLSYSISFAFTTTFFFFFFNLSFTILSPFLSLHLSYFSIYSPSLILLVTPHPLLSMPCLQQGSGTGSSRVVQTILLAMPLS